MKLKSVTLINVPVGPNGQNGISVRLHAEPGVSVELENVETVKSEYHQNASVTILKLKRAVTCLAKRFRHRMAKIFHIKSKN